MAAYYTRLNTAILGLNLKKIICPGTERVLNNIYVPEVSTLAFKKVLIFLARAVCSAVGCFSGRLLSRVLVLITTVSVIQVPSPFWRVLGP